MLPRGILEDASLYQKHEVEFVDENRNAVDVPELPNQTVGVAIPALNLLCPNCGIQQTFRLLEEIDYHEISEYVLVSRSEPEIHRLTFECQACQEEQAHYFIEFNVADGYVKKVGQEPGLPIGVDSHLKRVLGDSVRLYMNGRICENNGLGIAAFAYYRRLVEMKIDDLLNSLSEVMDDGEAIAFRAETEAAKDVGSTAEKIRVLAPKLPKSVFIAGNNPLTILYRALSEGLHNETDEKCLDLAHAIRVILEHVYQQVEAYQDSQRELKDALSRLQ